MNRASTGTFERLTRDLLQRLKITTPPIPLERLAGELGAALKLGPCRDRVLRGFLIHKSASLEKPLIWVNSSQRLATQRFTIAHEIAHMILEQTDVHVDARTISNRRDGLSKSLNS